MKSLVKLSVFCLLLSACAPGKKPPENAASTPTTPNEAPKAPSPAPESGQDAEKPQAKAKAFEVEAVYPEGQTFLRLERLDREKKKITQYRLMLSLPVVRAKEELSEILIESTDQIVFKSPAISCPLKSSLELKGEESAIHFAAIVPTGGAVDKNCDKDFSRLVTEDFHLEFSWKQRGFDVLRLKASIRK